MNRNLGGGSAAEIGEGATTNTLYGQQKMKGKESPTRGKGGGKPNCEKSVCCSCRKTQTESPEVHGEEGLPEENPP